VFNGNKILMEVIAAGNLLSWVMGLSLVGNYTPGSFHELMSYLLTSVMGGECLNLLLDSPKAGVFYFLFSYAYQGTWLLFAVYEIFLVDNHFMELLLTSCFQIATMSYIYYTFDSPRVNGKVKSE
jgi:hypothetical protein